MSEKFIQFPCPLYSLWNYYTVFGIQFYCTVTGMQALVALIFNSVVIIF